MNDTELRALLEGATTIAVVGASTDPAKAASKVVAGLINAGYTVIPVHPTATEILGQPAYSLLADIPGPIDIVDFFRPSAETPAIAEQAAAVNAAALWLQLGITSPDARQIAHQAGMTYLENNCLGTTAERSTPTLNRRPRCTDVRQHVGTGLAHGAAVPGATSRPLRAARTRPGHHRPG